jgi:hypothetical protein
VLISLYGAVSTAEELAEVIEKGLPKKEYQNILMNSKKILENHV